MNTVGEPVIRSLPRPSSVSFRFADGPTGEAYHLLGCNIYRRTIWP